MSPHKKYYLFIISIFLFNIAAADEIDSVALQQRIAYEATLSEDTVARYTDSVARFPKGYEAFRKFCSDSIEYSKKLAECEISGRVVIRFVVEEDGRCAFPTIYNENYTELDKCALNLFYKLPKFTPAYYKGVPVRSILAYPFYIYPPNKDVVTE